MDFLFWNFLIRYFQVTFINFHNAGLTSIQQPANLSDKIVSANILAIQYLIVAIVCYILVSRNSFYLDLESTKKSIGNLYLNLNTFSHLKLLYGAMFYIQRISIVFIVALKIDFGLQWVLIQIVVLGNFVYLLRVKPYLEWQDARVDYFNTALLLLSLVLFASVTPWITDENNRYQNGIYFDCLISLGLVLNLIYIAHISFKPIKLKIMRTLYQRNLKEQKRQKQLEKDQKAQNQIPKVQESVPQVNQSVPKIVQEPKNSQVDQPVTLSKEVLDELNSKTKAFNIIGKFIRAQKPRTIKPPQTLSKDNIQQMNLKMKNFNTMYKYMQDQKNKWILNQQKQQIGPQLQQSPVKAQLETPPKSLQPAPTRSQKPKFAINYNLRQVNKPFQRFNLLNTQQLSQPTTAQAQMKQLILQQSLKNQLDAFDIENQLWNEKDKTGHQAPISHHAYNFTLNPHTNPYQYK